MRFGVYLNGQTSLSDDIEGGLQDLLRMFGIARDGGWSSAWLGHHYLPGLVGQLQPVPVLARLAAELGQMRLGTGIHLLSLQNPVAAAEDIATLDLITGGQFVYGVGAGYRKAEFQAFGVEPADRVDRFERNLDIILRLWAGERVTVDLPWCRLDDAQLTIRCAQRPRPPVWVAATDHAGVDRASRLGDAWLVGPHVRTSTIIRQLRRFDDGWNAAGRSGRPEVPIIREAFCALPADPSMDLAKAALYRKYGQYTAWGQGDALPSNEVFEEDIEQLATDRFILGSPDECIEKLLELQEATGATELLLRTSWSGMSPELGRKSLDLLTTQVLPAVNPEYGAG